MVREALIDVDCPYCRGSDAALWAEERGYSVVRCVTCDMLYLDPAPDPSAIGEAVRTGFHSDAQGKLDVRAHRSERKVATYEALLKRLFADVWAREQPLHWLDVGAGYGELIEAVGRLAPKGSIVEGLEPMGPKAAVARGRGLTITEDYLRRDHAPVDFISSIDVFSHIPDYRSFLADVVAVLKPGGEFLIETGNLADVDRRDQFGNELGVPDHLVFAGKKHIVGYLEEAGFEIRHIEEVRTDDLVGLAKNVVKKIIGRPALVRMPYTSNYRQLIVRAQLVR